MMYSEFQGLTGLTISNEMYEEIEKVYNDNTEDKKTFCENFYKAYSIMVVPEVNKVIHQATMEEKLDLIEGLSNELRDRADKIRNEKMWQLINGYKAINWYQTQEQEELKRGVA